MPGTTGAPALIASRRAAVFDPICSMAVPGRSNEFDSCLARTISQIRHFRSKIHIRGESLQRLLCAQPLECAVRTNNFQRKEAARRKLPHPPSERATRAGRLLRKSRRFEFPSLAEHERYEPRFRLDSQPRPFGTSVELTSNNVVPKWGCAAAPLGPNRLEHLLRPRR